MGTAKYDLEFCFHYFEVELPILCQNFLQADVRETTSFLEGKGVDLFQDVFLPSSDPYEIQKVLAPKTHGTSLSYLKGFHSHQTIY